MPQANAKRDASCGNTPLSLDYSIFDFAPFARCHRKLLILLHSLMFSYVSAPDRAVFSSDFSIERKSTKKPPSDNLYPVGTCGCGGVGRRSRAGGRD